MPPYRGFPWTEKLPIGPLLLWVGVDPWPHMLWFSPETFVVPGMILMSSAASRPDREIFSTMPLFNVWLDCPESTGTGTSPAPTTSTSCDRD